MIKTKTLKEINIKNCTCYHFDDIINIKDLNYDNILLDQKTNEIVLIYDVGNKTPCGFKPLHSIFDEEDEYVRKYDGTKYLAFFHSDEKLDRTFEKIRYLVVLKSIIQTFIVIDI